MAIIQIPVDDQQKEKITFYGDMLHYSLYPPGPKGAFYGDIPWHWHEEFEFGYIFGGKMLYKTPKCQYTISQGDGIFVNSGTLHYLHPLEPKESVVLCSQFIDQSFLAGTPGSRIDTKYIVPVLKNPSLDAIPILHGKKENTRILDLLLEAIHLGTARQPFFEMRIRNLFSQLWETIYALSAEANIEDAPQSPLENDRIKEMLQFIQSHYSEHLTIRQIAKSIPISERECFRLFKTNLGMSPMEYLIAIRLQAARDLLIHTKKGIMEIAMETGFGSSSYFGKIFRQEYGMTPRQYRNINQT